MPRFRSDEILWYNVGTWGELGYAVPNFGDNHNTLNSGIGHLVGALGRNLSAVMHHADADLRVPPSINTLQRVHKLCNRARQILAGRAVPASKPRFEPTHATPAPEDFLIFPVPYFKVRNAWMKEWCGLTLNCLSEAMQHTDNRLEYEISEDFASRVGQYVQRIYKLLSTELFQVPLAEAEKPDFVLTEAHFQAYNPAKWFTSTELLDTVRPSEELPTEDDLLVLTEGIPASMLVGLQPYPRGLSSSQQLPAANEQPPATAPAFPAPPPV